MKKLKSTLVILVASLLLCTQALANRTAPQFPEFSTIESGKTYYLYNVGTEKFLTRSTTNTQYPAIGEYNKAEAVDVIKQTDGSYTLQFSGNKYYIIATSSTDSQSWLNNYSYFTIAGNASGYKIQRATVNTSYYNETEFIGYPTDSANDRIVPTLTDGNIVWKFIEKDAAEYYIAKRRLYEALLQRDTYFYAIDSFEKVYNDAASSTELLKEAADEVEGGLLLSSRYVGTEWSDYLIFFTSDNENESEWEFRNEGNNDYDVMFRVFPKLSMRYSLKAHLLVDEKANLSFYIYSRPYGSLDIYVDNVKVRTIRIGESFSQNIGSKFPRYFIELSPGYHEVEWVMNATHVPDEKWPNHFDIKGIGVEKTPYFEVSLLEPGSLGTEVLYNVDNLKDVRCIKIKGRINDEDWSKIRMLENAYVIDLSEAITDNIPNGIFNNYNQELPFLHKITLPESIERIGDDVFHSSYVNSIRTPLILKHIGKNAFAHSMIEEIFLSDSLSFIGDAAFSYASSLKQVGKYPKMLTFIPKECFKYCISLESMELHDGICDIYDDAFSNAQRYEPEIPKSLRFIGNRAFSYSHIDTVVLPENVSVSSNAFYSCNNLNHVELPTSFHSVDVNGIISSCGNLKTLVLKSPTVVVGNSKSLFLNGCPDDVVIKVPSFLVNSYKLDEYWYNYKIEGFNTGDIKDWTLNSNLVMNARERFDGEPNLTINKGGSIKLNGDAVQVFDSLCTSSYNDCNWIPTDAYARILVNNNATSIEGEYKHNYYVKGKYWFFVSLPFDFKVSDVTADAEGTKFVFRYYDGASRAANGASGNWKNYAEDAVITAGTGFIVQASADCWLTFTAFDNENKQNVVSNEEFVKSLAANPSEKASNSGWNLVGNPWQCYFNIHALNFTAPITTYDVYNKKYNAYSIIDDDYAIEPNEAFFVQCPENINSISFPETGRQLTNEIVNQQSAPSRNVSARDRQLVDILLSCGDINDRTRVVFNDAASMEYETACDASKFFATEGECPQLYSIDGDGTEYAINERPYDNGNVQLGVIFAKGGTYTFSLSRCDAKEVVLFDEVTGVSHNFADGDYTFTAEAGRFTGRFMLGVTKAPETTSVAELESAGVTVATVDGAIEVSGAAGSVTVVAADGRIVAEFIGERTISVAPGVYIVRTDVGAVKVVVKK